MAKKLLAHGRRWFAFLLCRTVNTGFGMDADRLLEAIPSPLFEEWRLLYEIEPWGDERADFAIGTAIMHNVAAHGLETKDPMRYMRYLRSHRREKPQSEATMKAAFDAICRARQRMDDERRVE